MKLVDNEICQKCGKPYLTVYNIPNEIWIKISPKKSEGGLLCISCCDELAREQQIVLYWQAKETKNDLE